MNVTLSVSETVNKKNKILKWPSVEQWCNSEVINIETGQTLQDELALIV